MIKSDIYHHPSRRTRSELIGNALQDPIARKEAIDLHLSWSQEFGQKAAEARSKKNYSLLGYYSSMRHTHLEVARGYLDDEFFDEFCDRYEKALEAATFDLHGFSIKQSLESLKLILNPTNNDLPVITHGYIDIITGRGAHSSNNNPRIKPSISSFLTKSGIKFSQINPGCFRVNLDNSNLS
uniref:NEDD4-binding protein 2 (Trinotate prediction) n=1 Tax=Myxobolus squamalis TaxID=59785 RepID=A0A6B2G227_MYXSQ